MATKKPPKGPKKKVPKKSPKKKATKKVTKKKATTKKVRRLPENARVYHTDGRWRDKDDNLVDPPGREPAYRANSDGTFTPFRPREKHKKTKQAPRAFPKPIPQASLRTASIAKVIGERKMYHDPGIAAVIQEASFKELKNRLLIAHQRMAEHDVTAYPKISENRDFTIDSELAVEIDGITPAEAITLVRTYFKVPPGMYVSIGWRWENVPDMIQQSFPLFNTATNEVVERKSKNALYQLQTSYSKVDRRVRGVYDLAEKTLGKVFRKARESGDRLDAPRELYIRVHWNPYDLEPSREE